MDQIKGDYKSEKILERIFLQITANRFYDTKRNEWSLSEDEKAYLLCYLKFLGKNIVNKAKEISLESNNRLSEEDLKSAIRGVIPQLELVPSSVAIKKSINDGKNYLIKRQQSGGWGAYRKWMSSVEFHKIREEWDEESPTTVWDTSITIITLLNAGESKDSKVIRAGVEWLKTQSRNDDGGYPYLPKEYWKYLPEEYRPIVSSVYETSYAMIALLEAGEDVNSAVIQENLSFLIRAQNKIYKAWGATPDEEMSVGATSSVILALIRAGIDPKNEYVQSAIKWLKYNQREDGSWSDTWKGSSEESKITKTCDAISALLATGSKEEEEIIKGIRYLRCIQKFIKNENEEWGWVWMPEYAPNIRSDISPTESSSIAIVTLLKAGLNADSLEIKMGIRWLLKNIDTEKSWGRDTQRVIYCLSHYLKSLPGE
jgi:squalene-hopene/tetraprenyl-beta-curcumene cyclase